MNALVTTVLPSAVDLIRIDHAQVLSAFHQYNLGAPARARHALASTIFTSLEIHATLEEEIFYPAVRYFDPELVAENVPEQREWRNIIARLRTMDAAAPDYDPIFLQLMRSVFHHVADEETLLLPQAEHGLGQDQLARLGADMTRRRLELSAPRARDMVVDSLRGGPGSTAVMATGALVAGTYLLTQALHRWRRP